MSESFHPDTNLAERWRLLAKCRHWYSPFVPHNWVILFRDVRRLQREWDREYPKFAEEHYGVRR